MAETRSIVLGDAQIVLAERVIEHGWLRAENGRIVDFGEGNCPETALSLEGDLLIPGLVELHTDHLETHIQPRPRVDWDAASAVIAYDAQIAAAGITTVFDCLRVGGEREKRNRGGARVIAIADTLATQERQGNLRAEHHTHLRCEVSSPDVVEAAEAFVAQHRIGIISLMDHTPGQRQFRDVDQLRAYYKRKLHLLDDEVEAFLNERCRMHELYSIAHRKALVEIAHAHKIKLASHDDTTVDHVEESAAAGASLAEFPTTLEAAQASHEAGIAVVIGAPNLIRGGSHSGNVAASELAALGLLDILSSDYIPASLLMAAMQLPDHAPGTSLPKAIATVTRTPARAAGLDDRGEIAVGLRADLVHVRLNGTPVVRTVWREGRRVL